MELSDLSQILAALGISGGYIHPQGHVASGMENNIPMTVDYGKRREYWQDTGDPRIDTQIHAGGFTEQDKLSHAMGGTDQETAMHIANALYKLGYLSKISIPRDIPGDVESIEKISGNKYTKPIIGASALMDILKASNPKDRWDVQFIAPEGAPGLQFNYRW